MPSLRRKRNRQRGAALLLFLTVLVLGVCWYTVGALGKAASANAEREAKTAAALSAAKQALLGYAAQYAARTEFDVPGRLPCPEALSSIGTSNEGDTASNCSNSIAEAGRLPWRTLGVDRLQDGDGEPLWYVLSPGFRSAPVNFGTTGQLTLDGAANAAVALIIAPGKGINSLNEPGTPPAGCSKINQQTSRYANPLDPAKFFECGNAAGSYLTAGGAPWSNDRVLAVTAAEWADAIAGPVADRLQRQVAPALNDWRLNESNTNWGKPYLPHASTFTDPATNDLCGDIVAGVGQPEGMLPTARATASCTWWNTPPTIVKKTGSGSISGTPSCSRTTTALRCFISYTAVPMTIQITATGPNVALGFRRAISAADVTFPFGNAGSVSPVTLSADASTGAITGVIQITMPSGAALSTTVDIKHLPDAAIMNDARMTWFLQNNWDRHVYYAVSRAAKYNPSGGTSDRCLALGQAACLIVNGLPASNGWTNDKLFVLALMGRTLASQNRPSASAADYLEGQNASLNDQNFEMRAITSTFNDRIATCPFAFTPQSGTPTTICSM